MSTPSTPKHEFFDILVTPEVATEYLAKNPKNRLLSPYAVASIANQMSAGQWVYDGSPIRFDWDGHLIDGQHRLSAIVLSGQEQTLHIVTGLDPATMVTMDTGRKRSFADTLHMEGKNNSKYLASIVQVAYRWYVLDMRNSMLFGGLGQHGSMALNRVELLEFEHLFSPSLSKAADYADQVRRILPIPPRMIGTLAWLLYESRYAAKADEFLNALKDGEGLVKGSPILALRNQFISSRGEKTQTDLFRALSQGIHAWNLWVANKEVTMIRTPSTLPTPK